MKKMQKITIVIAFIMIFLSVYYLYTIKPLDTIWNHCVSVMSGKERPDANEQINMYYRLDGAGFQDVSSVDLKIYRYLIYRWGNQIKMTIKYSQDYYDKDGNLVYHISNAALWIFIKTDSEWILDDIISAPA